MHVYIETDSTNPFKKTMDCDEEEHQIFNRYRRALAIRDSTTKTCGRCGKRNIPVKAFVPHKMIGQPDYCPTCYFVKEAENLIAIDALCSGFGKARTQ